VPKFAANLTMLFTELDFLDRFDAAASAGFKAVEFLFPYSYETAEIRDKLARHNLRLVLHNLPAGNWAAGDRGIACLPDRIDEYRYGVAQAIEYAKELGCSQLNCLAGIGPDGADPSMLYEIFVGNLRFSASLLERSGIRLLIEPINTRDIPRFFLSGTQQAVEIIRDVGSSNLKIQYDVYHMQIMEGDLAPTIERNLDLIGHIQVAENPGRHEPGTGEINFDFLFGFLDSIGYQGWIGCEYKPKTVTDESLEWFKRIERIETRSLGGS
jgi:hydroxypyruvate isomerase